jgi:photosystem II stability/assembly factor-like uncharacterized protein
MAPSACFVAFGEQGLRMRSENGRDWSEPVVEKDKLYCRSAVYGDGRFLVLATYGEKTILFGSEDGANWERLAEKDPTQDGGKVIDLAYGNGRYVALGGHMDGHWTIVMTSADGRTWDGPKKFDKEPLLLRVIFGGGKFLACGYKGRVAFSENGEKWTDSEPLPPLDTFISVAYGNGLYVGAGLHGLRMRSEDGSVWTDRVVGEEGEHINAMLWTGERFVGVGLGATYFSPDGKTWERVPNRDAPVACEYGDGLFVGANWRGRILVSTDAIAWEEIYKAPHHVNGIRFGGG